IEEGLRDGKVVIVAGYQGVSRQREVTTLGRGGSDTTAVALAAALGADCEIYSDVDGIFTADPRVVPSAKKLDAISHDEMQELASAGAKVLNAQAVEFAREKGIVIHARSTHGGGVGTRIEAQAPIGRVKGVTCESDLWVLEAAAAPGAVLELLDGRAIKGRTLVSHSGSTWIVVPLLDIHGPEALKAELTTAGIKVLDGHGTVTCVGTGLNADWSVLRRALAVAASMGAGVFGSHASALQLTLIVDRTHLKQLTRRLHEELIG
ncbi:MAG: aspartokinase, partial [Myxococcaceae bacterium]|nr:aspartokinase [Myxococcaceae bacterium]